jgi:hypothetical protein
MNNKDSVYTILIGVFLVALGIYLLKKSILNSNNKINKLLGFNALKHHSISIIIFGILFLIAGFFHLL